MFSFLSKRKKRGIAADEIPEGTIANLDDLELELTHVGRYEIVAPIGSGGMGTVYKAIDRERDLTVAIKVLDRRYDLNKRRRSRDYLGREIEIAASLNHPAIVKIHKEIIVQEDRQGHMRRCLLMEFVDGPNLRKYIQDRSLTFRQMMDICRKLCMGLDFLHQNNVVHRDIKPENFLLTRDMRHVKCSAGAIRALDRTFGRCFGNCAAANTVSKPPQNTTARSRRKWTRSFSRPCAGIRTTVTKA